MKTLPYYKINVCTHQQLLTVTITVLLTITQTLKCSQSVNQWWLHSVSFHANVGGKDFIGERFLCCHGSQEWE